MAERIGLARHKCLHVNRDDFAALHLQNLLLVEPFVAGATWTVLRPNNINR